MLLCHEASAVDRKVRGGALAFQSLGNLPRTSQRTPALAARDRRNHHDTEQQPPGSHTVRGQRSHHRSRRSHPSEAATRLSRLVSCAGSEPFLCSPAAAQLIQTYPTGGTRMLIPDLDFVVDPGIVVALAQGTCAGLRDLSVTSREGCEQRGMLLFKVRQGRVRPANCRASFACRCRCLHCGFAPRAARLCADMSCSHTSNAPQNPRATLCLSAHKW